MKFELVQEFPHKIIFEKGGPCISLYQPTHRYSPDNKQDPIRFKNLVKNIEKQLEKDYSQADIDKLLAPYWELSNDEIFWNNSKDGLVILSNEKEGVIYKLSRDVKEFSNVDTSFHIKPLIRTYQSADTYYVLGINRKEFKLYVGNRYNLKEVNFDENIAIKIEDVLGDQVTEGYLNQRSVGGPTPMFHGQGSKKDEIDKDIENYFRYIDKLVLDNFSNPTRAPLVLVALDEYQGLFRKITSNRFLIDRGIDKDFESLDLEKIREESWTIIEPLYINKTEKVVDRFNTSMAQDFATDDYVEASRAAVEGKIELILIESDKIIPGRILEDGRVIQESIDSPKSGDILDNLSEVVLKNKGEVIMLPKERMPNDRGVAAIFRY